MKLSIIMPALNEEQRIGRTLEEYTDFFNRKYKKEYELIVVMNGCTDNTSEVVEGFKKKHKQVKSLEFKERIGKGGAIIEGFKVAQGDFIGFADADNSTSAEEFEKLVENIGSCDGIIASRYVRGAVAEPKQSLSRRLGSRGFNVLIRIKCPCGVLNPDLKVTA